VWSASLKVWPGGRVEWSPVLRMEVNRNEKSKLSEKWLFLVPRRLWELAGRQRDRYLDGTHKIPKQASVWWLLSLGFAHLEYKAFICPPPQFSTARTSVVFTFPKVCVCVCVRAHKHAHVCRSHRLTFSLNVLFCFVLFCETEPLTRSLAIQLDRLASVSNKLRGTKKETSSPTEVPGWGKTLLLIKRVCSKEQNTQGPEVHLGFILTRVVTILSPLAEVPSPSLIWLASPKRIGTQEMKGKRSAL